MKKFITLYQRLIRLSTITKEETMSEGIKLYQRLIRLSTITNHPYWCLEQILYQRLIRLLIGEIVMQPFLIHNF